MMEKRSETNFRKVTTNVTISEGHSLVRMKTARMQTYLRNELRIRKF